MRIHHLNCGSMCPHGRRLMQGEGRWLEPAQIVCPCWLIEGRNGLTLVDTGLGTAHVNGSVHAHLNALMRPKLNLADTAQLGRASERERAVPFVSISVESV